jgi:plastocyanin
VPQDGAPAELNTLSGLEFNPGDPPRDVIFQHAGTFTIVCTIHPNMLLTVTVQ